VPWTGAGNAARVLGSLLRMDPPDHSRSRRLVAKAFTPSRVEGLEPRIRQVAEDLLAGLADEDEVDLIARFAQPLPIAIIADLIGVRPDDLSDFVYWSDVYVGANPQTGPTALARLGDIISTLIQDRRHALERTAARAEDAQTLLDALILARDEGNRLDENELLATTFLIVIAGYETTVNLIANGMMLL